MSAPARQSPEGPLSPRAVVAVVVVGIGTFVFGLLLAAFAGDLFGEASAGHDTWSRSLVGHRALRELLERSGLPVVVARSEAARRPRADVPLLLLEPLATDGQRPGAPAPSVADGTERLTAMLAAAARDGADVVVALPKWRVEASPRHPGWIESRALVDPAAPAAIVRAVVGRAAADEDAAEAASDAARIVRPDRSRPLRWDADDEVAAVDLGDRPQLVAHAAGLTPVIANADGVLVGTRPTPRGPGRVVVVADPDLLANQGIGRAENARVVLALLRAAGATEGVVVDETLHGYESADSLLGHALTFPLVLVVIHAVLAAALFGWAAAPRFGRPLPPPPALPPGKRLLIDNTAALLAAAGDHAEAVRRHLHMTELRVARRFALPEGSRGEALRDRLRRLSAARGVPFAPDAVAAAAAETTSAHEARRLARRTHDWERALLGAPLPDDPTEPT